MHDDDNNNNNPTGVETMSGNEEVKDFNWLYPDLIPRNELISILKQRYIKKDTLELLNKDELVELYNEYIIPLPQRKYRSNRRGRDMTNKQIIASKKRKLTSSEETLDDQPKSKRRSTGNLVTSFDLPVSNTGDRLKPPPSCINFEKKKIKLSTDTVSSSLDSLTINKRNNVIHDTQSVKKMKLSDSTGSKNKLENETIKEEKSSMETNNSTDNDVSVNDLQKKKIKKISWP